MKSTPLLTLILFLLFLSGLTLNVNAGSGMRKTVQSFTLGETQVNINVYEKPGSKITFFAPHHNEQTALNLAKEYVEKNGGRVIEVVSFDDKGLPSRYLKFTSDGKPYNIDPNRIFTDNGRLCNFVSSEVDLTVKTFADNILKLLFAPDGKSLRDGESIIIAVHNNTSVDAKAETAKLTDLNADAFLKGDNAHRFTQGAFSDQADGVFLSNLEEDADNFVFLSTYNYLPYFAARGFNVIVQKSSSNLRSKKCTVDDGSLSVYSGMQNIPYICLESDGTDGGYRQRQMIEAVYQLAKQNTEAAPKPIPAKP